MYIKTTQNLKEQYMLANSTMAFSKVILFGLGCLAANIMLASSDCTVKQSKKNFDYTTISGRWFIRIANKIVLDAYHHYVFNFKVLKDKLLVKGTVQQLPSAGGATIPYEGEYKIAEDHSSRVSPTFSKALAAFDGTYVIQSVDSKCYFIAQGCPNGSTEQAILIKFRDEHPSDECLKKAEEAFKEAGYSLDQVEEDPTFSKKHIHS